MACAKRRALRQLIAHSCVNAQSIPVGATKWADSRQLNYHPANFSTQAIQETSTGNNSELHLSFSPPHILVINIHFKKFSIS
jgi:hypothetical protein